jgi:hypothetical protein
MCGVRIELPGGGEIKSSGGSNAVSDAFNGVNRDISNAGNSINSAAYQATGGASNEEILANLVTQGLVGYDPKTGQIKEGVLTRAFTEGAGQITGANAARAANNRAEQLLADQRAEADRLRQEELARLKRNDTSASRAAGTNQRRSLYAAGSGLGSDTGAFNNLTRDFLGL